MPSLVCFLFLSFLSTLAAPIPVLQLYYLLSEGGLANIELGMDTLIQHKNVVSFLYVRAVESTVSCK